MGILHVAQSRKATLVEIRRSIGKNAHNDAVNFSLFLDDDRQIRLISFRANLARFHRYVLILNAIFGDFLTPVVTTLDSSLLT